MQYSSYHFSYITYPEKIAQNGLIVRCAMREIGVRGRRRIPYRCPASRLRPGKIRVPADMAIAAVICPQRALPLVGRPLAASPGEARFDLCSGAAVG